MCLLALRPGYFFSARMHDMPLCAGLVVGSVFTRVATTVERSPLVTHILVPSMT